MKPSEGCTDAELQIQIQGCTNTELQIHRRSIEKVGFTHDFGNEVPYNTNDSYIDQFITRSKNGKAKTYSQRFSYAPRIVEESDPTIVKKIDSLMSEAIEAAIKDDRETVKIKVKALLSILKK